MSGYARDRYKVEQPDAHPVVVDAGGLDALSVGEVRRFVVATGSGTLSLSARHVGGGAWVVFNGRRSSRDLAGLPSRRMVPRGSGEGSRTAGQ
jgi:hypothetical protein